MAYKVFKFKLYRAKRTKHLVRQIELSAWVYNHCIALHKRYYRLYKKTVDCFQLLRHLTKIKKHKRFQVWQTLNSQTIQNIAKRLSEGYKLFFKALKQGRKTAPPTFKSRHKYKSFTLLQHGWKLAGDGRIHLMGKEYRFHQSRPIEGKIKTVTIKRDAIGDLWLFFAVEFDFQAQTMPTTGKSAGFDFGLKEFLTPSDESPSILAPQPLKSQLNKIRKTARLMCGKVRGSRNRQRARLALARLHRHVTNQRISWHWQLAHQLCQQYDALYLETLSLSGMRAMWGRKMQDLGFAGFLEKLTYKTAKHGRTLRQVGKWEPTSKRCSVCGKVKATLTLAERHWQCEACGVQHDRDRNAARNIYAAGKAAA